MKFLIPKDIVEIEIKNIYSWLKVYLNSQIIKQVFPV